MKQKESNWLDELAITKRELYFYLGGVAIGLLVGIVLNLR